LLRASAGPAMPPVAAASTASWRVPKGLECTTQHMGCMALRTGQRLSAFPAGRRSLLLCTRLRGGASLYIVPALIVPAFARGPLAALLERHCRHCKLDSAHVLDLVCQKLLCQIGVATTALRALDCRPGPGPTGSSRPWLVWGAFDGALAALPGGFKERASSLL
jgi:hypothetical protein